MSAYNFIPKKIHGDVYGSLTTEKLANSQAGRTVLVAGASSGLGFAIAKAFAVAGAARVIITGRTAANLEKAKAEIESASSSKVIAIPTDSGNVDQIAAFWKQLANDKIEVDVFVIGGGLTQQRTPLLETTPESLREYFEVNVVAAWAQVQQFAKQGKPGKALLYLSSGAVQFYGLDNGLYPTTKTAFQRLLHHLADEVDEQTTRVVSIHPGLIFTEGAKRDGWKEDSAPYDNIALPANFFVWASNAPAAAPLHGRFWWAGWDIDELAALTPLIKERSGFLRLGLSGVPVMDGLRTFGAIGGARAAGKGSDVDPSTWL